MNLAYSHIEPARLGIQLALEMRYFQRVIGGTVTVRDSLFFRLLAAEFLKKKADE